MTDRVELPTKKDQIFSTYHFQIAGETPGLENPTYENRLINDCTMLTCNRKFLRGYTTPELYVEASSFRSHPALNREEVSLKYVRDYEGVICQMLNCGCYVFFMGVDDYYVPGKSWYMQQHRFHDGLIYGYDGERRVYMLYAYDSRWLCRPFEVDMDAFNYAFDANCSKGFCGSIIAVKANDIHIDVDTEKVCSSLGEYLAEDSTAGDGGTVRGSAVIDHLAMYIECLRDGSIPYERLDHRVFRSLWDHRKCMKKRIGALCDRLGLDPKYETEYGGVMRESDFMRMIYAKYFMYRDDRLITDLKEMLMRNKKTEKEILTALLADAEKEKKQ